MNTSDLRKILVEDLVSLRSGTLKPSEARARAALAKSILDTLKLELVHHAMNQPLIQAINLTPAQIEHEPSDA